MELAGLKDYSQIGGVVDGASFAPLLKDPNAKAAKRPLVWHFPNTYDQPPYSSIRYGDWKLVIRHASDRKPAAERLFNLAADPGETRNLAAEKPELLAEMKARLEKIAASDKDSVVKD